MRVRRGRWPLFVAAILALLGILLGTQTGLLARKDALPAAALTVGPRALPQPLAFQPYTLMICPASEFDATTAGCSRLPGHLSPGELRDAEVSLTGPGGGAFAHPTALLSIDRLSPSRDSWLLEGQAMLPTEQGHSTVAVRLGALLDALHISPRAGETYQISAGTATSPLVAQTTVYIAQ